MLSATLAHVAINSNKHKINSTLLLPTVSDFKGQMTMFVRTATPRKVKKYDDHNNDNNSNTNMSSITNSNNKIKHNNIINSSSS